MYDARDLANLMLDQADELSIALTNMSLNKLLYIANGCYLADYSELLVEDKFEAWDYGPVIPRVYSCFKAFGSEPITARAQRFDPVKRQFFYKQYSVQAAHSDYSKFILQGFGCAGGYSLSELSHVIGDAWSAAYKLTADAGRTHSIIKSADIKKAFSAFNKLSSI